MSFQIQAYQISSVSYSRSVSMNRVGQVEKSAAISYSQTEIIAFSGDSRSMQALDALYEERDALLENNLSAKDMRNIDHAYDRLQEIFSSFDLSDAQQEEGDALFDSLDTAFNQAQFFMPPDVKSRVESLNEEISAMEEMLDEMFTLSEEQEGQLVAWQHEQSEILLAQLSATQSESIESLNQLLKALFEELSPDDEQQSEIDEIFAMLDAMLGRAFEQMSPEQQAHKAVIDAEISQLESQTEEMAA
ncbi:hypothetical protein [Magnetococcus sp. PR-3]|uniref:hypothetical protein n=1 Tax=Magnetococcus sp. PR-3 TaxID=3120355 RepID=UPI002FCE1D45